MTITARPTPVRRSPIEGASRQAPATGTTPGAVLEDLGPLDKVVVRGIGDPDRAGRVVRDGSVALWHLGPDEAIVVARSEDAGDAARIAAGGRSSVDVSSGYATLRLRGQRAGAILAEACAVDLGPETVADDTIVQANVANVRVILARSGADGAPAFTLLVARDEARYLWDVLTELGSTHGLVHGGGA